MYTRQSTSILSLLALLSVAACGDGILNPAAGEECDIDLPEELPPYSSCDPMGTCKLVCTFGEVCPGETIAFDGCNC